MRQAGILRLAFALMLVLMMVGIPPKPASAVVGAYVELHVAECPPGYDGNSIFEDCHENRVAGVTFIAAGAGGERYEGITSADGVAFFNDFYTAGPLKIIQQDPAGDALEYTMYCTTVEDQVSLPVTESDDGRAAPSFDLPQPVIDSGTGVVCDWYSFPPEPANGHRSSQNDCVL